MPQTASHIFPTSTYFIQDKCTVKIGDEEYETLLSYNIYVETNGDQDEDYDEDYDVIINRTNFKVDQQKIETKFLEIANQYMEALFPLKCQIVNHRLKVINLNEIRINIKHEDQKLSDIYSGEGLDHIRSQFFSTIENDEKLSEFIKQLYFMKVLNLGMQKFEKKQDYFLQWNVLPINTSEWKGNIKYTERENKLIFEPKIDNAQDMMDEVIKYVHQHDVDVNFDEENLPLYADFKHRVNYTGKTGRMENAETEVCIDIENKFYYQQNLTLQAK